MTSHENLNIVAIGLKNGDVFIVSYFMTEGSKDIKIELKKLKWHSTAIRSLHFFENYLFSSANERVLVRWDIENLEKALLPRLPSEINRIELSRNGCIGLITEEKCIF